MDYRSYNFVISIEVQTQCSITYVHSYTYSPLNFLIASSMISVIRITASSSNVRPINCNATGVPGKSSGVSGNIS